jgi:5,10-methylenetetrahydromethanopterin reductase
MRVGVFGFAGAGWLDDVVAAAQRAAADGMHTFWMGQAFSIDALTSLAVVAREVEGIELATGVVPIQTRHPQALAAQALTTQGAARGRLTLGIGASHRHTAEARWGYRFDRPVRHMREYVLALRQLLRGEDSSIDGELVKCSGALQTGNVAVPPLLIAALGPAMLRLAGQLADGTVTGETGPRTVAEHIVPTIRAAAAAADRPSPRVVVCLPICVTDDAARARERLEQRLRPYATYPSFRAMLDREGVATGADVAIIGDEDGATVAIERLEDAGGTDFAALESPGNEEEAERTRAFLRRLAIQPATSPA